MCRDKNLFSSTLQNDDELTFTNQRGNLIYDLRCTGCKQDLFTSFVPLQREQQQLKSAASKKETSSSPKVVGTPQDKAQIEHLKQACQERDGRIQQLEQELGKARQALQSTTEKYRELSERETKSVACSTEDLPTMEERFDRSTPRCDVAPQGPLYRGTTPVYGSMNGSVEGQLFRGPLAERVENGGPQNNVHVPHKGHVNPSQLQREGPSRTPVSSVPGSPNRRHLVSRGSVNGVSGRASAQGYQLPPTPPSGGRGSRGRRNSAGNRYTFIVLSGFH